jgi:hypothetical protein
VAPHRDSLRMYGQVSDHEPLPWSWVEAELEAAPTYWVVAGTAAHPAARPVWGVWRDDVLYLSIGSPTLQRALDADPRVTVHLESGTDVVIVEGNATTGTTAPEIVGAYDAKYDWSYDTAVYGDLVRVQPAVVKAWRAAGWAGRDSFTETGRWTFPPSSP